MKYNKVVLQAYYGLGEGYIEFPENPLHGKEFYNVEVEFTTKTNIISGVEFIWDVIKIEGEEPIECELVGQIHLTDDTMIIQICEDWG
jgi:hypothetical protein